MHIDEILQFVDSHNALENERPIRSMSCNFVAPFQVEKEFSINTEVLREGGNVSSVQTNLLQNDQVCVSAQFVFGSSRDTKIEMINGFSHTMQTPKKASFVPNIPGIVPKFLKHFDIHFTDGGKPFTRSKKNHIHGWMRFTKKVDNLNHAHLIALIDAWPPTLLQKLSLPAPGSTMTWKVNFVNPEQDFSINNWFAYQADTLQYSDGYGLTSANVWDQHGNLLAISTQTVTIFA